ncbi:hypothetical protein H5410_041159 [Solanum commersonii]|uniref:Uncharacterized protein n=1 Tax=Solanum commersonii TaxID=4109 RepID=A0A9J5XS81_SOLCO|nr:hypothetical protein H5410_041159 [Solanum commersonii]
MEQNYMATFNPYMDEGKGTVIDALKAQLKGVIVLTSRVEYTEDEYLVDHNLPTFDENLRNLRERVVTLEQSRMEVVAHVRNEKLERIKKQQEQVDEEFAAIDKYLTDIVDEVVVDEVVDDIVDKVAVDAVEEMEDDVVDAVAVDLVDRVIVVVDDEMAVDEVAVDEVAVDIVDEAACDAIDEMVEEKKEEENKMRRQ